MYLRLQACEQRLQDSFATPGLVVAIDFQRSAAERQLDVL